MSLPASGSLSIKGAAGVGRSLSQEVDGNETGSKSLSTLAGTAGYALPASITDFYGYDSAVTPPDAPSNMVASVLTNDVSLTWDHTVGVGGAVTNYRVERNAQSTGIWEFVADTGTTKSHTNNDLAADQYTFRVRAENSGGQSVYTTSNSVIVA